ncbi:PKD domain-containing protein [Methanosarcina siciliae]|nr:PKD domain-containing protein [Methanosarcina siciliae]
MNTTSKHAKYLIPILLILLFAGTASALPTATHDTIRGEMYVSSIARWGTGDPNNFNVPNGTVVFARYYVGVWADSQPITSINTTFNGHAFSTYPSYYSSGMGVTWIPYDVTDYVHPGEVNIATIDSSQWGDGRQYGTTLVVVLENKSKPQIEYWIADGLDWMHCADVVGYDTPNSTTVFNGTVDLSEIQNTSLYSTHLTGYNYEDLNGNSLPSASEHISCEYFDYLRWNNIQGSLLPENQTVLVSRESDPYCSVVFHALSIEYKAPDLVPVSLTPSMVSANITNTMTATIENRGSKDSQPFNVSIMTNDKVIDTQPVSGLAIGNSTRVEFHWTPDGDTDVYSLTIVADPENILVEPDESNNKLEVLVGTTSAPIPISDFSGTPTSGDSPLAVTFKDQSTNSPTSWAWDFDNDGRVDSTEQNPVHTYVSIGNYSVNLTVTNAGGNDSEVKNEYIVVKPLVADFTTATTSGRVPFTVKLMDASSGSPTSWFWDFGDGTNATGQNVSHTYTSTGTYTVNLTVTNAGGANYTEKPGCITAMDTLAPIADFNGTPTSGNVWLTVNFTDQSANAPTSWLWDFGDGATSTEQSPSHTYKTAGTYTVNLTATNAIGTNSTVKKDYITASAVSGPVWTTKSEWSLPYVGLRVAPSLADLDGDGDYDMLVGVSDGTVCYENTGTSSSPIWTLKSEWTITGVNNPSPALADLDGDGDYDLMIGMYSGKCYGYENTGTTTSPVWTAKSAWNVPDDLGYYSSASLADLDGDGDYDLLMGAKAGSHLTAYENTGTKTNPAWTAKSAWNTPSFVSYSGYTAGVLADLDGDGDYDLLLGWSNGDIYAYENTGTVNSPVWTKQNVWDLPPVGWYAHPALADLDGDEDYDLLVGEFNGSICGYENTASSAVAKPDITPTAVTPPSGIVANTPCTIVANINNTGTGNTGTFNATLSVNGTVVDTQSISGISSDSSALVNFTWTPEAAGDYNLTVTADSENGIAESDETNNALTVLVMASAASGSPVANFTADITSGNDPLTVNFMDQSTGTPTSWFWDFGDGVNSTEQSPVHTYTAEGNYTVNLTVENSAGTDFEVKTDYITVLEPSTPEPVAMFTADATSGTVPLTVNFTDQSTGSPTSWAWDFGDGENSTEQNPVHTYSAAGNYTVNLTVENSAGTDFEVKTDYITVLEASTPEPEPVAAFTADVTNGDAPLTVNFTDQSTGSPTSWFWDFGDGANSTEQNPVHTYASAGSYTVNLTVENAAGTDFELKSDYIEVSEISGSTVTLYFDPASSSVSENESTEINLVASNFPAGLSGYNLTVAIDDPAIAEIVDIEYPSWALITENSTLPGTSIYMKTVDLEDSVKEGAADVVLATLTVSGKESGSANLSIGVKRLEEDSGDSIEPEILTGKIEVTLLSPLPDQEYAPKDLDGDGFYEDLTGNGEFSFVDIVAYFHNMDWIEENMPVEYFDFNGNGRIDFDDVVDMFGMI